MRVTATPTRAQLLGMARIRVYGSTGWCKFQARAGGAISRMFDRMANTGWVTKPPIELTPVGNRVLDEWLLDHFAYGIGTMPGRRKHR
jgi:hypothetical protein